VDREPFLEVVWTDRVTGRKGFAVIDRLVNGIAGGGTRMRSGVTLEEVRRLARTMSIKNGAINVPGGGAKGGLDCDPHDPEARPMLVRFVTAMRPLLETYWGTAEDMGTTQELLDGVFAEVGLGTSVKASLNRSGDPDAALQRLRQGLAVKVGGVGLADTVGGFGVAEAALAAAEHRGWEFEGMRASVQGFGAMGGSSARRLTELGARVVAIADVQGTVANPDGLDVETLIRSRSPLGDIDRASLRSADVQLPREAWLDAEAEILVPAAVADAIDADNVRRVKARMVVEAANIPTTEEAQRRLHERGLTVIPDFVANGGTNAWFWWVLLGHIDSTAESAFKTISENMRRTVKAILEASDRDRITTREAAERIALRNLDRLAQEYGEMVDAGRPLAPGRT
jgi:glutamate dehydrogenase (NAD(P)+)